MRSKIISGMSNAQAVLWKKGTVLGSRVSSNDRTLFYGDRVLPVFFAPLLGNTKDNFGALDTFARATDGMYLSGGLWNIAGTNVARFEDGRLLMEPAETNINTNWNANPDVALININPGAATLTRVSDPTIIAEAGLQGIATEGNVVDLNNTSGGTVNALIGGQLPITADYYADIWVKPFSTIVDVKLGSTITRVPQNESFNRVSFLAPSAGATTFLTITLRDNTRCRFLLNNTYQGTYLVNPIVTQGASASRAIDQLSWANADSFFNQQEGMAIVTYTPKHSLAELPTSNAHLVSMDTVSGPILYFGLGRIRSFDGTNVAEVALPSFSSEQELKFASLWGPGGLQVGYKYSGSWTWSPIVSYSGAFSSENILTLGDSISAPARFNNLYIYKDNKSTAWIESVH